MPEKKKIKPKVKPKAKPKAKPKDKPKDKPKPKPKPIQKVTLNESGKVIVQIEKQEKEQNDQLYDSKLKHLLNKIKSQSEYADSGIRFAWRN